MRQCNEWARNIAPVFMSPTPPSKWLRKVSKARFAGLAFEAGKDSVTTEIRQAPASITPRGLSSALPAQNPGLFATWPARYLPAPKLLPWQQLN